MGNEKTFCGCSGSAGIKCGFNLSLIHIYGRFNQGVVTINLVDVACSSEGDMDRFWEILDAVSYTHLDVYKRQGVKGAQTALQV